MKMKLRVLLSSLFFLGSMGMNAQIVVKTDKNTAKVDFSSALKNRNFSVDAGKVIRIVTLEKRVQKDNDTLAYTSEALVAYYISPKKDGNLKVKRSVIDGKQSVYVKSDARKELMPDFTLVSSNTLLQDAVPMMKIDHDFVIRESADSLNLDSRYNEPYILVRNNAEKETAVFYNRLYPRPEITVTLQDVPFEFIRMNEYISYNTLDGLLYLDDLKSVKSSIECVNHNNGMKYCTIDEDVTVLNTEYLPKKEVKKLKDSVNLDNVKKIISRKGSVSSLF